MRSTYIDNKKSDGTVKGFYHSLSPAIDSLSTGGAGAYIYVGSDCTIDSGVTVSIPSNTTIKFGSSKKLIVNGTLNIAGGSVFDKYGTSAWCGIDIEPSGTLNVNGGITIRYAYPALKIRSSNVTFPNFSTSYFEYCPPPNYGTYCIDILNSSPILKYIEISNSAIASGKKAVYIRGASSCPNLYNITIKHAYEGIYIYYDADAILKYSIIDNTLSGDRIYLRSYTAADTTQSTSAGIDISWGQTDVFPDTTNAVNERAINNPDPHVYLNVYNTYWGSSTPFPGTIFESPSHVRYSPFASFPFNIGASKIAVYHENPFHVALSYEQVKDWNQALNIYYDIVSNSEDLLYKRMAIKQILKVDELSKRDFSNLRNILSKEIISANGWYKPFLDYISCEILIKEGKYQQAIDQLIIKAEEDKRSALAIEMVTRIAVIYGDFLNDKEKAKEFADKAASLDPGDDLLEDAYASAGIEYNSSLYRKAQDDPKIVDSGISTNQSTEYQENTTEEFIAVSPNPANPMTTITFNLKYSTPVRLEIYSINGQKVATLFDGPKSAGIHLIKFDGSRYASGVYFYKFESRNLNKAGKFLLLK
jgi:hypothetical protein